MVTWRVGAAPGRADTKVLTTLRMYPLFDAVSIPFVQQFLDAGRRLQPNEIMETSATAMLDELVRTTVALRALREPADRGHPAAAGTNS